MPRKYRLTGLELKDINGLRVHGAFFSLMMAPVSGAHNPRCACVVSKKVAVHAPERNTIKRRCRSVLSKIIPSVDVPYAFVLYAKKSAVGASFADIKADIEALIARALRARS